MSLFRPTGTFCAALLLMPLFMLSAARAESSEDHESGRRIFTEEAVPHCAICHTLADADTDGTIGPNLDELKPTEDRVRRAVTDGVGVMPSYKDSLSEEQIAVLAEYVSAVAGQTSK